MTLHMWFGLSVKCLDIRSPPDASTRRSQLRHTKVNLRGNETSIMLHALKKSAHSLKKCTHFKEDGFLLWSIFWNIFLVLWNLTKTKERFVTRDVQNTGTNKCNWHYYTSFFTHLIIWFPMETLQLVRYLHAPQAETNGKWERKWSTFEQHSMHV